MKRLNPATVIACLALLIALGGTGYAARGALLPANSVGSKQVINHSLKKVDLKAPLPRGPRGPAGSAGIARVTSVIGPPVAQCPSSGGNTCRIATATVTCPAGSTVVGGGHMSAAADNIVLVSERTSASVYSVTAENLYVGENHIWAQAICASGPGLVGALPMVAQPNIESVRQAFTP